MHWFILLVITDINSDILLVDTKANLNLYKESSYLQQSTCCTPSSCSKQPKTESVNVDYNEWAGRSKNHAHHGTVTVLIFSKDPFRFMPLSQVFRFAYTMVLFLHSLYGSILSESVLNYQS